MGLMQRLALMLTWASLAAFCSAQQQKGLPTWLGKAAGAAASKAGYDGAFLAQTHPFRFLEMLADMPPIEQKVLLSVAGEGLRQQLGMSCNIFGGARDCQPLPASSAFAKECKGHDMEVDCAYASSLDDDTLETNPVNTFKGSLDKQQLRAIQDGCPQCFSNLQAMWCAQTVPKCGSFESVVEGAILPALKQATDAADSGKGVQAALAAALPELIDAVSLSMPCREMCESIMATCACGDEPGHKFQTFGQLLDEVVASYKTSGALARIPEGFSQTMFGRVRDRPLCSLFAWANATDFAGTCDTLPSTCLEKKWCSSHGGGPNAFEQSMALQLAKTVFGWVGQPDGPGLFQTRQAIIDKADSADVKKLSDKYLRHQDMSGAGGNRHTKGAAAAIAILVCFAVAAYVGLGVLYWRRRQAARADAAFRDDRDGYAAIPLASAGNGDHETPL